MEEDGYKSKIYRLVVFTFVFQSHGEIIRLCLLVLQIPITRSVLFRAMYLINMISYLIFTYSLIELMET